MVHVDPKKYFARNKSESRQDMIVRLRQAEVDIQDLSLNLIKAMTLCEALSQIVIEGKLVTEEEYHEHIKRAMAKFQMIRKEDAFASTDKKEDHISEETEINSSEETNKEEKVEKKEKEKTDGE